MSRTSKLLRKLEGRGTITPKERIVLGEYCHSFNKGEDIMEGFYYSRNAALLMGGFLF